MRLTCSRGGNHLVGVRGGVRVRGRVGVVVRVRFGVGVRVRGSGRVVEAVTTQL